MDDTEGLDPELIRFLREELGHDMPAAATAWSFAGPLRVWRPAPPADGAPASSMSFYYVAIAGETAAAIQAAARGRSGSWGMVRIKVAIGVTRWQTSLFRSKEIGGYVLPMKAAVRKAVGVVEGDPVTVELSL